VCVCVASVSPSTDAHVCGWLRRAQRGAGEVRVGRHPDNDVVLDARRVKLLLSRHHARLLWDAATAAYAVRVSPSHPLTLSPSHGATEKGPGTMDKSQTFAAYVYMQVPATIMSRGIGGRREMPREPSPPPKSPYVTIRDFCIAVYPGL
jgi:hypothetical protein